MEPSEVQTNLEELEERIDRVRALYEQYFCGIEKIEPQIPRKDVDRRIFLLRKEQIRNTAMRFKFQTLVQRYNTMSQHWGRVLREIENGTFKRDLARAAARFGVDEALTAVGRKRAERLAKGLEAQLDREARRKQAQKQADEYEVVDDADIEAVDDFDDDAPTPPPVQRAAGTQSDRGFAPSPSEVPFGVVYPDLDDDGPRTDITDVPPVGVAPKPQASRTGFGAFGKLGARPAGPAPQPSAAQPRPVEPDATPYVSSVGASVPPGGDPQAPRKSGGGLRLGGGPNRRANPEALNRIATTLQPGEVGGAQGGLKPLLSSPLEVELGPEPPGPRPAPQPRPVPAAPASAPGAPPSARRPLLSAPLEVDVGNAPEPPPPPKPAPPVEAAAKSPPEKEPGPASESANRDNRGLGLKPPPRNASAGVSAPARPTKSGEDISDQRLREIYSQYVNTRRERNESTAGITFEKLADSLRSQADKLRSKHAAKRVDYEIVVKDGKTLIKPIVR